MRKFISPSTFVALFQFFFCPFARVCCIIPVFEFGFFFLQGKVQNHLLFIKYDSFAKIQMTISRSRITFEDLEKNAPNDERIQSPLNHTKTYRSINFIKSMPVFLRIMCYVLWFFFRTRLMFGGTGQEDVLFFFLRNALKMIFGCASISKISIEYFR